MIREAFEGLNHLNTYGVVSILLLVAGFLLSLGRCFFMNPEHVRRMSRQPLLDATKGDAKNER